MSIRVSSILAAACLLIGTTSDTRAAESLASWALEDVCNPMFSTLPWVLENSDMTVRTDENNNCAQFFAGGVTASQFEFTMGHSGVEGDNDMFGLALGFDPGESIDPDAEYLLLEWDAHTGTGSTKYGGLSLFHVKNGPCNGNDIGSRVQRNDCSVTHLARGRTLGDQPWSYNDLRTVRVVLYSVDRLIIDVFVAGNPVRQFDLTPDAVGLTCFPLGGIAFYNYSQDAIHYGDLVLGSADYDGDGVADVIDNCASTPNSDQENQDGDCRGDVCDADSLFWSDTYIGRTSGPCLDSTSIVAAQPDSYQVAIDPVRRKVYWAKHGRTDGNHAIRRANYDGSNPETVIVADRPFSLAVDAANEKLYWGEAHGGLEGGVIRRAALDGTGAVDLISTGITSPGAIALDVPAGHIYWTDWDRKWIRRANLADGSDVTSIVTDLCYPVGLAIDLRESERRLYITESGQSGETVCEAIERVGMDGTGLETLASSGLGAPFHLAVDTTTENLYVTSRATGRLSRLPLAGGSPELILAVGNNPWGLALIGSLGELASCDCGDGVVDPFEECDDGNTISADGCSDCEVDGPTCGDGLGGQDEECDLGKQNGVPGSGCDSECNRTMCFGVDCNDGVPCTRDQCNDEDGTCLPGTPQPQPVGKCREAENNSMQLIDKAGESSDKLKWRWSGGTQLRCEDFGDPRDTEALTMCIFDNNGGSPTLSATIQLPPSNRWAPQPETGDPSACFATPPGRWRFSDSSAASDGVKTLRVRLDEKDTGKASIAFKALGVNLVLPGPVAANKYFEKDPDVVVQMENSSGLCWVSRMDTEVKNSGTIFKTKLKVQVPR